MPEATTQSPEVVPEKLVPLSALRMRAQDFPEKRKVLLILHPNNTVRNARFIDPFLGVLEFDDFPGMAVWSRDINEHQTTGIFVD